MKKNNSDMKSQYREDLDLAVYQFNDWVGKAVIYWFAEDDRVTTYVYASSNEWDEFYDIVIPLYCKGSTDGRFEKVSVEDINKLLDFYKMKWESGQYEFDENDYNDALVYLFKNR